MKSLLMLSVIIIASFVGIIKVSGNNAINPALATPEDSANVDIQFDGIQAVCFGNPQRVSSGIIDVPYHVPQMIIKSIHNGQTEVIATLDKNELKGNVYIDVEGNSRPSVSRYYAPSMTDEHDFRWNVDMESDLFQKQLHLRADKIVSKIHFSSGLFYADHLSDESFRFMSDDDTSKALPFHRRIAGPAAKMNLATGDVLLIKSSQRTLRLPAITDVRYQIEVNNLPPADMANMNHWRYYYDAVSEKLTPYLPLIVQKAAYSATPFPCRPGTFSKSQLND